MDQNIRLTYGLSPSETGHFLPFGDLTELLRENVHQYFLSGKSGVLVRYSEAARPSHKGSIIMT